MTNIPLHARVRRTPGSRALGKFIDAHGLRPVAVYIPTELHRALAATAIESDTSLQALLTLAVNTHYGCVAPRVPPLVAPTRTKQDPHKSFTWYADVDLHKSLKMLAVEIGGTVQQLVLSAAVEYMKHAPRVAALAIPSGFPAYARAPALV